MLGSLFLLCLHQIYNIEDKPSIYEPNTSRYDTISFKSSGPLSAFSIFKFKNKTRHFIFEADNSKSITKEYSANNTVIMTYEPFTITFDNLKADSELIASSMKFSKDKCSDGVFINNLNEPKRNERTLCQVNKNCCFFLTGIPMISFQYSLYVMNTARVYIQCGEYYQEQDLSALEPYPTGEAIFNYTKPDPSLLYQPVVLYFQPGSGILDEYPYIVFDDYDKGNGIDLKPDFPTKFQEGFFETTRTLRQQNINVPHMSYYLVYIVIGIVVVVAFVVFTVYRIRRVMNRDDSDEYFDPNEPCEEDESLPDAYGPAGYIPETTHTVITEAESLKSVYSVYSTPFQAEDKSPLEPSTFSIVTALPEEMEVEENT